jgi:putative peptidoglycan lipid II flippase
MATATATPVPVMRRIVQSTGVVMITLLASRVLGFVREWALAHQVGSNATTDAYYAAFTLPDFLNFLVAAGSLSVIFVPVFTHYLAANQEDEAWYVFSTVLTFMGVALLVAVALAEIFSPQLVRLIAPGFPPAEKARVVYLTRIMLPAQIFVYLGTVLGSAQYAKAKFLIPSLAPVIYNAGIVVGGLGLSSRIGVTGFAVGVLLGASTGYFLIQIWGVRGIGARFVPNLNLRHPGFRMFVRMAIPIMFAISVVYADDWIIRWFGSYLVPASISWLSYAKTLMRVPLGVVGQSVGVVLLPFLSQAFSEGRLDEFSHALDSTLRGLILLVVPVSALTMAESSPIVYLVFSKTRLHGPDFDAIALCLVMFSIGMFAWSAQNILARAFYAAHDTITPAVIGAVVVVVSLPLYWLLYRQLQHLGLALASSIGVMILTVAMFLVLRRKMKGWQATGLLSYLAKITASSAAAGLIVHQLTKWLEYRVTWHTMHGALFAVTTLSVAGFVLMILFAKILRVPDVERHLGRILRRG